MGSYAEEIFKRKEYELNNLKDYDKILPWLLQDPKGNLVRKQTRAIRDIAKDLAEPYGIEEEALIETNLDKLDGLRTAASRLTIRRSETSSVVDSRIEGLTREEVTRQEAIRTEQIAKEQLLSEWKKAETIEEEIEARRLLKETLPLSLRSAKGYRTREGKEAFRMVMG